MTAASGAVHGLEGFGCFLTRALGAEPGELFEATHSGPLHRPGIFVRFAECVALIAC